MLKKIAPRRPTMESGHAGSYDRCLLSVRRGTMTLNQMKEIEALYVVYGEGCGAGAECRPSACE